MYRGERNIGDLARVKAGEKTPSHEIRLAKAKTLPRAGNLAEN